MINWNEKYKSGRDYKVMNNLLLAKIIKESGKARGNALDLGCGTGDLVVKLAKMGFLTDGIDGSEESLKLANDRATTAGVGEQTRFFHANLEGPFPNALDKYDIITCKLVVAFIQDLPAFIERTKSILKPNGVLVVITPIKYKSRSYSDKYANIAIFDKRINTILADHFESSRIINTDYADENGEERVFLCQ